MRPVGPLSKFLTVLLLISPVTARAETEASGCELLPDTRIACSAVFMRQLAEGYQHARAGAKICEVRLNECRSVPPPVAVEPPPISPLGALVVGGTGGIALAAGVAVLVAGGPVEVGASLAAAGGAGLTAGAVVLTW